VVNVIAARGGASPGAAHLSVSPSQAALTALTRCLATILAADEIAVHGLMPQITPAGGTGRTAAPVLGIEFGERVLTADQVGEAVVELARERTSRMWKVGVDGLTSLDA
jgi:NAD(P)-dependent dehydrogenase (short-subunit alcohol dehydrogenase family)